MRLTFFTVIAALMLIANQAHAGIVTFGSGANSFNMEFVTIGDAGNVADTTGSPNPAGSVAYEYQMGKYEVSRGMIDAANNLGSLGITMYDMASLGGNDPSKPATGISWLEAAKFVNWLNTSQGHQAAYKFTGDGTFALWGSGDAGYDASNRYRNSLAVYVLPSVDEWYKAAYYDALLGVYYDYATGSDTAPSSVTSGVSASTAVYGHDTSIGPALVDQAGGVSPYGTHGQGGNAYEWNETDINQATDGSTANRVFRGGSFYTADVTQLSASYALSFSREYESFTSGFRVVNLAAVSSSSSSSTGTVPEPTTFAIWGVMGLAVFGGIRRRRNRSQQDKTSQVSES